MATGCACRPNRANGRRSRALPCCSEQGRLPDRVKDQRAATHSSRGCWRSPPGGQPAGYSVGGSQPSTSRASSESMRAPADVCWPATGAARPTGSSCLRKPARGGSRGLLPLRLKARPDTAGVSRPTFHAGRAAPSTQVRRAAAEVIEAASQRARPEVTRLVATSNRAQLRLPPASRLRPRAPYEDGA
jgi:hypothetical protein